MLAVNQENEHLMEDYEKLASDVGSLAFHFFGIARRVLLEQFNLLEWSSKHARKEEMEQHCYLQHAIFII